MGVTYMRHPTHGSMVFSTDLEVGIARGAGWEVYDPTPPAPVPSFLAPSTPLPPEFPGREALIEAGMLTMESIAGKTKEELLSISGVGEKTAKRILDAQ